MQGREIRTRFMDYFAAQGHTRVPSSALVPADDPTLLFTNAGMVQFKDVFTGRQSRGYSRAATVQKCMRAGGKHNDLENVGPSGRHLTFFEMLGNFSFGDYFKREAIAYAWELLTGDLRLPRERLWASVFEKDDEAEELWRAYLPQARIVRLGEKDNFWAMGETGPCGPCSEIHFDRGPAHGPDGAPGGESDRYLEIWNLVFMQYDRSAEGELHPLPRPSIDTGAGLERLAMVMQDAPTLFETDLFAPVIAQAARVTPDRISQRVIADHARAAAFLMADGVFPEKAGRSYVLRRIMRRAIRHGAGAAPFFHESCLAVVDAFRDAYPELHEARATIAEIARLEEARFRETLERGLKLIHEWRVASGGSWMGQFQGPPNLGSGMTGGMPSGDGQVLPGDLLFKLYDTYGFPTDLVEVIGREQGFSVDLAGFDTLMREQQERSGGKLGGAARVAMTFEVVGSGRANVGGTAVVATEGAATAGADAVIVQARSGGDCFVGWDRLQEEAWILRIREDNGEFLFVSDATPFYAESGGQVSDTGTLVGDGYRLDVTDVQRSPEGLIVHRARLAEGRPPAKMDRVVLKVDAARRVEIVRNHSGTHLLHHALRTVLGDHVMQKGSLVAPDRLRFDFSHFRPVGPAELRAIQDLVAERVLDDAATEVAEMSFDEAKRAGAMAFFGDKYGDRVRVVRIGRDSLELCGGTHVARAGEIGLLKVTTEGGIAQGVRRIEAVTGTGVLRWTERAEQELDQAAAELKSSPFEVAARIERLRAELRDREREIESLRRKLAGPARDVLGSAREVRGVKVICQRIDVGDPKALRDVGDGLRDKLGSGVLVLAGVEGDRLTLLIMVSKDLTDRVDAGKLMKAIAPVVGARGGGKPELAQAGGGDPARLEDAFARVYESIGSG
jgi:alanyl-tRNA synthetase